MRFRPAVAVRVSLATAGTVEGRLRRPIRRIRGRRVGDAAPAAGDRRP